MFIVGIIACQQSPKEVNSVYHDNSGRSDLLSGGVQMIPINTLTVSLKFGLSVQVIILL